VLVAMGRGAAAGMGGETGRPPDFVFEAAGVPRMGRPAGGGGERQEPLL